MTKITCNVMKLDGIPTNIRAIRDENGELITYAEKRSIEDYKDECVNGNNECAELLAKYERVKDGKIAYLWFDNEVLETYISF